MELALTIIVLAPILIIGSVIWTHVKKPAWTPLVVAREWQTLIGALLGFALLALTLVLNENYEYRKADWERTRLEVSYYSVIKKDLYNFMPYVELRNDELAAIKNLKDVSACNTYIREYDENMVPKFYFENSIKDIADKISPQAMALILDAINTKRQFVSVSYLRKMGFICADEPEVVFTKLRFHNEYTLRQAKYMYEFIETMEELFYQMPSLGALDFTPYQSPKFPTPPEGYDEWLEEVMKK